MSGHLVSNIWGRPRLGITEALALWVLYGDKAAYEERRRQEEEFDFYGYTPQCPDGCGADHHSRCMRAE